MRRVLSTTVFILLASLTGCSGDTPSEEPHGETSPNVIDEGDEPVQSPAVCAEDCSNQEVAASGCDQGKPRTLRDTQVEIDPKRLDGVAGVLELRMADPTVCESLFWARFRPYAGASANWVVTITVTDRPYEDQASDQGPNVDGYTEGVYAAPGADIEYCVTQAKGDGSDKVCESVHINQGGG